MKHRIIDIILASKGGVGKSILTYLIASAKIYLNEKIYFIVVDLDHSTQTSLKQLSRIINIEGISLVNERNVLIRDKFISYIESLQNTKFDYCLIDAGSPESEQFSSLLLDVPIRHIFEELGFTLRLNVVMAEGTSYRPCVEYLTKIIDAAKNDFEIIVWENISTFTKYPSLRAELHQNLEKIGIQLRRFGNLSTDSDLDVQIINNIRLGNALAEMPIGARYKLMKEFQDNFTDL